MAFLALVLGVVAWPGARAAFILVGVQTLGLLAVGVLLFVAVLLLVALVRVPARRGRNRR